MKILPVIDLLRGVVVRGIGGRRAEYRPITSAMCDDPSPASVARAFHEKLGCDDCYLADLDAIAGGPPNEAAYNAIVDAGLQPWIDAGSGDVAKASAIARWLDRRAPRGRVVVGLESLVDLGALRDIVVAIRADRTVFSLDLREGIPLTSDASVAVLAPLELAAEAIESGVRSLIALDLAAVGMQAGVPTLDLCRMLRERYPQLELTSGGGVRTCDDLDRLAAAGCDRVLVASALHEPVVAILRPSSL